ncbi:response regulator transcription factor [Paracidovorax citrulli]
MMESDAVVYVMDDDEAVAKALARLLQAHGYRVRWFCSAADFLQAWSGETGPACLLLDVRMPGMSGIDVQHFVGVDVPAVMVSGYTDVPAIVQAMQAGAVDFLQKPVTEAVLLPAVSRARRLAVEAFGRRQELRRLQSLLQRLTPREREVMAWVVTGRLNKQVASELGTVEKTIKAHRARVMQKLEVGSLPELVRIADKMGLCIGECTSRSSPVQPLTAASLEVRSRDVGPMPAGCALPSLSPGSRPH